ncbi:MAG: hypothetical protein ACUVV3_06370 [Dehalococcoidia bacterium]
MKATFLAATLLLAALTAVAIMAATAYALFTDSLNNTDNTFSTDTLDPPTSLTATVVGSDIRLDWTPTVDTYATGYKVLRATTSGGPYTEIDTVTPYTETTYTDPSPGSGTFYYVLRSYYQNWESADSNEASATI